MLPPHSHRRNRHGARRPSDCVYLLGNCFWHAHSSCVSSARCGTWLAASWNMKRPPIIWKIEAYWSENLPPGKRTGLSVAPGRGRAGSVLAVCAGSIGPVRRRPNQRVVQGVGTSVDHRSSLRRARFWCVGSALTVQRWCSTSRSAGECVQSQRLLPGMVAGVVPLVLKASPESSVADFCKHVDTRIREALKHQRFPVHAS